MRNFYLVSIHLLVVIQIFEKAWCGSVNPIWISNSFFETQPAEIKTDLYTTFNQNNPITKTFNFVKTYTQVPQLAFGIKNYRGTFYSNFKEVIN